MFVKSFKCPYKKVGLTLSVNKGLIHVILLLTLHHIVVQIFDSEQIMNQNKTKINIRILLASRGLSSHVFAVCRRHYFWVWLKVQQSTLLMKTTAYYILSTNINRNKPIATSQSPR